VTAPTEVFVSTGRASVILDTPALTALSLSARSDATAVGTARTELATVVKDSPVKPARLPLAPTIAITTESALTESAIAALGSLVWIAPFAPALRTATTTGSA